MQYQNRNGQTTPKTAKLANKQGLALVTQQIYWKGGEDAKIKVGSRDLGLWVVANML